jgi:hypothetical protein
MSVTDGELCCSCPDARRVHNVHQRHDHAMVTSQTLVGAGAAPGIDFTNLRFGQKYFGKIYPQISDKVPPKKNISNYRSLMDNNNIFKVF